MVDKQKKMTLSDVGEFDLLNKYILPILNSSTDIIGDDCAFIKIPKSAKRIIITTDAGPRPIFYNQKYPYYYIWGWYTVLANVSDLASTGSFPLAISLAVEAKSEMLVSELMDFFKGVKTAAKVMDITVSGGNIKANTQFISNATAIGYLKSGQKELTRRSCKPGDIAISVGDNGKYIVSYLKFLKYGFDALNKSEQLKISSPLSQLRQMQLLNSGTNISAASDNSDSVLGSLWNIAEKSNCGFQLDFDSIKLPGYITAFAKDQNLNPWNLFLFWGDWQVILTLPPSSFKKFELICKTNNIGYTVLGKATKGLPQLTAKEKKQIRKLKLLRNENFSNLSYNSDTKNHMDYLLKENLFEN